MLCLALKSIDQGNSSYERLIGSTKKLRHNSVGKIPLLSGSSFFSHVYECLVMIPGDLLSFSHIVQALR